MATIEVPAGVVAPQEAKGDPLVVVTHAGGYSEVIAGGDLETTAAWRLRDQLTGLVESGEQRIVLDVEAVGLVDFAGVGVLIGALVRASREGAQVVISPPHCLLAKMLRRSGIPVQYEFEPG